MSEDRLLQLEQENVRLAALVDALSSEPKPTKPNGVRLCLTSRRAGYTQKFKINTQSVFLRTGEYADGGIGEIFIDVHKEGAGFRTIMACFARSVSIGLQYGVPLEEFVDSFVGTAFAPQGTVHGHERIDRSLSMVDVIFRDLAITYLKRDDLATKPVEGGSGA